MALNDEIGNVPLFNESDARNGTIVWNEYTTHTEELCLIVNYQLIMQMVFIVVELDAFALHILNVVICNDNITCS